jgi:16S rRNA (guanine(966)-N(2))-methyltransferase RsmD
VREALFSSLGDKVVGARVLDLFAGTGALGIEALSRGAVFSIFVEKSKSVFNIVSKNVSICGFSSKSRIVLGEAIRALSKLQVEGVQFDLVFLDPPYKSNLLTKVLNRLAGSELLAERGTVIAEHSSEMGLSIPEGLQKIATKRYAGAALTFIARRVYEASPRQEDSDTC